jgi:hypothetical protein
VGAVHPPLTKGQQECLVQPSRANDRQVDGDHYKGRAMEPWDIIEAWDLDFFEGSALSYLLRRKPGVARVTDLHKAIHYLEKCIEREQAK